MRDTEGKVPDMEYFVKITPEMTVSTISTEEATLDFWYQEIGCTSIECVRLTRDQFMIVDEEGLVKDPPAKINVLASCLYNYPLHGTVLIGKQGKRHGEPDIVGFTEQEVTKVRLAIMITLDISELFTREEGE